MTVPNSPSFIQVANQLNRMVPELSKAIKPLKEVQELGKNLTNVRERARVVEGEIKRFKTVTKEVDKVKKTAENGKKLWDNFLKKVPGKDQMGKAASAGNSLAPVISFILALGIATFMLKLSELVQFQQEKANDAFGRDLSKNLSQIQRVQNRVDAVNKKLEINNKDVDRINSQVGELNKRNEQIKEFQNNITYEVRQGRKIVEEKVEAARVLGNNALYEARAGRKIVEEKIANLNASVLDQAKIFNAKIAEVNLQIAKFVGNVKDTGGLAVNKAIADLTTALNNANKNITAQNTTIGKLSLDITTLSKRINTPTPNTPNAPTGNNTNVADIARNAAKVEVQQLEKKFIEFGSEIHKLKIQDTLLYNADATLANGLSNIAYNLKIADGRIEQLSMRSSAGGSTTLNPAQLQQINDKITQGDASNKAALDLAIAQIKQIDASTPTKADLSSLKVQVIGIDGRLRSQEIVNAQALPKLDEITNKLGFIPALTAATITPNIPTPEQINNAVQQGNCRSLNGGCSGKALNQQTQDIKDALKQGDNNILNKVNALANGGELALLNTINSKLGAQLPGGVAGKLTRFTDWLKLDRALNLMIFGATVHNAMMLSSDLGQTLLAIVNNVLQLIGLKDDNGQPFNIGSVISSGIENLIKGIVGAENYIALSEALAKANRIYQATTNVLNSFLNLSQTILQASELIAAYTGKIGNALKKGGVVLENAYSWMNPQPKFNRVTQLLENLQNGANTIQMVTQAPLDIINATTEFTNASTEFIKAIKEDDKPGNKAEPTPEPDELKAKESENKTNSQPPSFNISDLFDGDD